MSKVDKAKQSSELQKVAELREYSGLFAEISWGFLERRCRVKVKALHCAVVIGMNSEWICFPQAPNEARTGQQHAA